MKYIPLYFTVRDPVTTGFVYIFDVEAYGTFGLRGNGDFELWGASAAKEPTTSMEETWLTTASPPRMTERER
ncbi:hypothetical protein [Puniceicoccus vermicola]|uniref:Uncharacterized protein n=1 Tax=Puniceicoccus vermicola TaxID=388746 RepID=A0A7X1B188_9BACT|nr:hypothetical protein [Puniceicoccus vermicola]MBC2603776.1 hypothetical protein [Puniceicoccus vermicola]